MMEMRYGARSPIIASQCLYNILVMIWLGHVAMWLLGCVAGCSHSGTFCMVFNEHMNFGHTTLLLKLSLNCCWAGKSDFFPPPELSFTY